MLSQHRESFPLAADPLAFCWPIPALNPVSDARCGADPVGVFREGLERPVSWVAVRYWEGVNLAMLRMGFTVTLHPL